MPQPKITDDDLRAAHTYLETAIGNGFIYGGLPSAVMEASRRGADETGRPVDTIRRRIESAVRKFGVPKAKPKTKPAPEPAKAPENIDSKLRALLKAPRTLAELSAKSGAAIGHVLDAIDTLKEAGVNITRQGELFSIPQIQEAAWVSGATIELVSRPDNTFCFGAFGDLHAASKYTRWDVREDLVRRSERAGAQAIFDTGNWIDGACRFNTHDLVAHGFEEQVELLADKHPRTDLPIYAVTGDDHEGWIAQREGINVGRHCESVMRKGGHDWTDLGFMEAHITLRNANTGATAVLAVVHPGGGSAYALSYSIQKIIESYEGGEKPSVGLYGHYHKLWAGIIRNVWCVQTGCQQDQTPFMRKKRLEAHVGGTIIRLEQHPETGAILSMTPQILRYFNIDWYGGTGRWSHHGAVRNPARSIGG